MSMIFTKLLNMSMTAGWLILAVILLRTILKKAPKSFRMLLWAFVGIRLICPVSLESTFSLIPDPEPISSEIVSSYFPINEVSQDIPKINAEPLVSETVNLNRQDSTIKESDTSSVNGIEGLDKTQVHNPVINIFSLGTAIWLLGMIGMSLYTGISYCKIYRKIQESVPMVENIRLCDRISSPFILGIFRPSIYLPSNMSTKDMEYVIAHERVHLKRRDNLWKPLGFLVLTVYWFHPLVWVAYILFCKDMELSCDEIVIRNMGTEQKKPYSNALLNCSIPKKNLAACPLAFGEGSVKERIKAILSYRKPSRGIMVTAFVSCVVIAVCFLSNPKADATEQNPAAEAFDFTYLGTSIEEFSNHTGISVEELLNGSERKEETITYKNLEFEKDYAFNDISTDKDSTDNVLAVIYYNTDSLPLDEALLENVHILSNELSRIYGFPFDRFTSASDRLRTVETIEDLRSKGMVFEEWFYLDNSYVHEPHGDMVKAKNLTLVLEWENGNTARIDISCRFTTVPSWFLEKPDWAVNTLEKEMETVIEKSSLEEVLDFTFLDYIGEAFEEAGEKMGMTKEQIGDMSAEIISTGIVDVNYTLPVAVRWQDIVFTNWWNTIAWSAPCTISGGGYACHVNKNDPQLSELINSIRDLLIGEYGTPKAASDNTFILGEKTDFSKYINASKVTSLHETWSVGHTIPEELFEKYPNLPGRWLIIQQKKGEVKGTMHMDIYFSPDSEEVSIFIWYSIDSTTVINTL